MRALSRGQRTLFDRLLDQVLRDLPAVVRERLDAVPVCVDDWPDAALRHDAGCGPGEELFGLYVGVPLTEREHDMVGEPSELIYLFRGSLLAAARGAAGSVDEIWLAEQIRITLLHELGHHYGLDEFRLDELGYG